MAVTHGKKTPKSAKFQDEIGEGARICGKLLILIVPPAVSVFENEKSKASDEKSVQRNIA